MTPKLVIWFTLFVLCLHMGDTFDISINNEEIDNPGLIIKSKFKKYLPELQENLEIPITEKQQSIKESFIPRRINYPHYGLRSRFRKDNAILETTTTATQESETSLATNGDSFDSDNGENKSDSSDDESSNNEGNDKSDATFKSLSSSAPTVVHSRRSWIKDFLIFKEQKVSAMSSSSSLSSGSLRDKSKLKQENKQLQSRIKNYDDTVSDPRDLKRWVRLIADEGKNEFGKKHSSKNYIQKNEIELDIEEFIHYLVEEQGFNSSDLEFLRLKNLDYGLGEIEKELNKLKEAKGSPKVISIGGEDENSAPLLWIKISKPTVCLVIALTFLLLG